MAESHKFSTVEKLREAFPDIAVRTNKTRRTIAVYNSKENTYAQVEKGQFVVKIADRYEVHDDEPDNAKPAEASKESKTPKTRDAAEGKSSEDTPKAVKGNQTVVPEELGTPAGPESK